MEYLSFNELCEELSISAATGRNWLRLGKLNPSYFKKNTPFFSSSEVSALCQALRSGKNQALKSRRNKAFLSGNRFYRSYLSDHSKNSALIQKLLALITEHAILLDTFTISLLVADCALHLFSDQSNKKTEPYTNLLLQFLTGSFSIGTYDILIKQLLNDMDTEAAIQFCSFHSSLFALDYCYEPKEDVLGLLYISCSHMGHRKSQGSYYTPVTIAKQLLKKIIVKANERILDPCCGTGNFLLQLPDSVPFSSVFGNDLDPMSIRIARVNMALKYRPSLLELYEHLTESDYLTNQKSNSFHYIIGNPPWGAKYSFQEKKWLQHRFVTATKHTIESCTLFIEQSIAHLHDGGHLVFVLPEAILNVASHKATRELFMREGSIRGIDYLDNVFDQVQSPCVILDFQRGTDPFSTLGMHINTKKVSFTILTEREVTSSCFNFQVTDQEYQILQKIRQHSNITYLKGQADFALGIVTGSNKDFLSDEKTAENERIVKGSAIRKYQIADANCYITFTPEKFQQCASEAFYRAEEKLFYRFIGSKLMFAYDNRQTLSLNSCNIVIPRIQGLHIKYVLAILNSSISQFVFEKEFHSVKILRSHIEALPVPLADKATQQEIISIVDKLIADSEPETKNMLYQTLENKISLLFNLDPEEMCLIYSCIDV